MANTIVKTPRTSAAVEYVMASSRSAILRSLSWELSRFLGDIQGPKTKGRPAGGLSTYVEDIALERRIPVCRHEAVAVAVLLGVTDGRERVVVARDRHALRRHHVVELAPRRLGHRPIHVGRGVPAGIAQVDCRVA